MSPHQNRKELERLIRSAKVEHELPEGLVDRVRSAIEAAPGTDRSRQFRNARNRRLVYAGAFLVILTVVTAGVLRHTGEQQRIKSSSPARASEQPRQAHVSTVGKRQPNGREVVRRKLATPGVPSAVAAKPRAEAAPRAVAADNRPRQPLVAVIAARQPATNAAGLALKVGDRLGVGLVRTGKRGRLTLITRRGSEFTLNQNTELALKSPDSANLRRGEIYCRSREHEIARVDTSAGAIHLLGTAIDAATENSHKVAVTVLAGKVRLANSHGEVMVEAGKQALLVASLPPEPGTPVNVVGETAWYDGRRIMSDYGEIAYAVSRGDKNITEVWVMNADGSGKHKVKSYIGSASSPGPWLPGQQVLLVEPAGLIWEYPDFSQRRADTHSGSAMIEPWITWWLLDAATAQDASITVPAEYGAFHMALSPDATKIAFGGARQTDPKSQKSREGGIYVYDLETGGITRVLDKLGEGSSDPAWSPDGRLLAVSVGTPWPSRRDLRLVVVDTITGEVTDPGVAGADPCFSPDGTKIAYIGDIAAQHTERDQGKVFVLDLAPGSQPRQISPGPEGWGSSSPQWSPDGTRVLYTVLDLADGRNDRILSNDRILKVAAADGSGTVEVYRGNAWPAAWNRAGNALYVNDSRKGMLLVAADGSGVVTELGGTQNDSPLSPAEQADFTAAQSAVEQAVFQHAMGNRYAYYAQTAYSSAAHRKAARLFAEMPWRFPSLGLSPTNALIYADAEEALADKPASEMLVDVCKRRLSHAAYLVSGYYRVNHTYAPDLATLEAWSKTRPETTMNDVIRLDRDDISVIFRCPQGGLFTYTPPTAGTEPKEGDVMLTCPNHRDHKATWKWSFDEWYADTPSGWRITHAW